MKKIIFATGNADKMKEIRKILADLDAEVVSMKEAGIQADIVEDGKTFEENGVIKATAIRATLGDHMRLYNTSACSVQAGRAVIDLKPT